MTLDFTFKFLQCSFYNAKKVTHMYVCFASKTKKASVKSSVHKINKNSIYLMLYYG